MDNIVNGYYLFYHCAVYQYHDDEGNVYKDYEAFTSLEACNLFIQSIKTEISFVKVHGESIHFFSYDYCYYECVNFEDFDAFDARFDDNDCNCEIVIKNLNITLKS